ncbi:beta-1,3-galactosyl-O-glycosyl-glycoprotein beta-1,6-N-acetylglucosaminyltransferase-like [Saccoglossus kowalevskii]|uniref:Beta-1,3-galactosyl-O-glycosyl-glycoprotein beta-1,6-N-acetylglucosaminyltransferase-like n=1 Tax=Saccoglossus kowalevskii TaxID=10224 RepID=A0ABM0GP80_SACKO|nr:PREDICTED: beta-1,3-galactosyl-O-glycosyl-glycoprotein beta-1,6-N-acetylglucosaminyltransferase-like [Saccoglossus kowalevskii]
MLQRFKWLFGSLVVVSVLLIYWRETNGSKEKSNSVSGNHGGTGVHVQYVSKVNIEPVKIIRYTSPFPKLTNGVQCADIMQDTNHSMQINTKTKKAVKVILPDKIFLNLTTDCHWFAHSRGYLSKPVLQEELEFPLAFGILVYKTVHQVEQLLRTIYRPHNIYCIHVDKKAATIVHDGLQAIANCFDNVFIAKRLMNVVWGTITVVEAELSCQSDTLERNKKWKYYINLTGQEFPLKTNLEIVRILREFHGQNDIMTSRSLFVDRLFYIHEIANNTLINTKQLRKEGLPDDITVKKGELHCALSRPFVEYIHHNKLSHQWFKWLNNTSCPDESYYHSLSFSPEAPGGPGTRDVEFIISRTKSWKHFNQPCKGKYVRDVCIFSYQDLPRLFKEPHLFANKFHADYDGLVLKCLEEAIDNRTYNPIKLNIGMYRKFVKFRLLNETNLETWMLN